MHRLSEFSYQKYYLPNGDYKTWQEYLDINNLVEESITEEAIEQFDLYNYCKFCPSTWEPRLGNGYANYVSEMLNSTEFSKLITQIYKHIGSDFINHSYEENNYSNSKAFCIWIDKSNNSIIDKDTKYKTEDDLICYSTKLKDKVLHHMIEAHIYFISLILENKQAYQIFIEPKFTKETSNTTDIAYHIIYTGERTDGKQKYEVRDKIRKVGIRPQVGVLPSGEALTSNERKNVRGRQKPGDRYFPERTYFFLDNPNIKNDIKEFINSRNWKNGEYVIFKLDFSKFNKYAKPTFYVNTVVNSENNVFTYDSVSKQNIVNEITNINEL